MKKLTSRHIAALLLCAAAAAVAAGAVLLTDSDGVRSAVLIALVAVTAAGQLMLLLSVRNLVGTARREARARDEAQRLDLEKQIRRLMKVSDPAGQAIRLRQARQETADLTEALKQREDELAELGETLRRIEYELTLASRPDRDSLSRYDGVEESMESTAGER